MGYRHYFVLVEKSELEKLRKLSMDDLKNEFDKLSKEVGKLFLDFEDYFWSRFSPLFGDDKIIHELGKLYFCDTEERLLKFTKPINFENKEVEKRLTQDHRLVLGTKETLMEYGKICFEKVIAYKETQLNQFDDLQEPIKRDLNMDIIDLREAIKNFECISYFDASWDYKTAGIKMSTLVHYNLIDFEKYELLLVAW